MIEFSYPTGSINIEALPAARASQYGPRGHG